jgi:CBS-domain-containing membrane protein
MLTNRVSGLPVVDESANLVGVVTEGDFLRREEIGTLRQRPRWLEFLLGPARLASEYAHAAGRMVEEIMTENPHTVSEDDSLETVVELMERHRIKRLPVLREGRLVGIVSRADLVHALAEIATYRQPEAADDATIREHILAAFDAARWAPKVQVEVHDGVAELSGVITDERERKGLIIEAENVPGVKEVRDHLVFVEPISGVSYPSPEDEAAGIGRSP